MSVPRVNLSQKMKYSKAHIADAPQNSSVNFIIIIIIYKGGRLFAGLAQSGITERNI